MKRFAPLLALALAALPLGAMAAKHPVAGAAGATSPAGVTCVAGDPVVWVNTETKVYHLAGSTYYGKTKHGTYACASDAAKMGAHAAKRESAAGGTMGGAMGDSKAGCTMSPDSMGAAGNGSAASPGSSGGKHPRHKGGSTMMSPLPKPSPM